MNLLMHAPPSPDHAIACPKTKIVTFIVLTFLFSSIFWFLISRTSPVAENSSLLMIYSLGAMWCPAFAAIVTRLAFQRNLKGFGIYPGKPVFLAAGILIPVVAGLLMFGLAWLSGIAPFNSEGAAGILTVAFVPALLFALLFSCVAAAGSEFGWRGFLVPELARCMGFSSLALLSGAIWTVWQFPAMLFGGYHGSGPLWYSITMFILGVMGAGIILAWLRLASGSLWVAVLFHGLWNYFIQTFYPALTEVTEAGQLMLGEFGWFVAVFYVVLALVFWHLRDRLPGFHSEKKETT